MPCHDHVWKSKMKIAHAVARYRSPSTQLCFLIHWMVRSSLGFVSLFATSAWISFAPSTTTVTATAIIKYLLVLRGQANIAYAARQFQFSLLF